jgi:hypothetical protein
MDEKSRSLASDLRKMCSEEAADWLMDRYPAGSTEGKIKGMQLWRQFN